MHKLYVIQALALPYVIQALALLYVIQVQVSIAQ